jgi:hypothetical protein
MQHRLFPSLVFILCSLAAARPAAAGDLSRIWLTHPDGEPSTLMVNWESSESGPSRVEYGATEDLGKVAEQAAPVRLHHLSIPFPAEGTLYYRVSTGDSRSAVHPVKTYSGATLRIAAAANWYFWPSLDAVIADDPHLLLSCGDMVVDVLSLDDPGARDHAAPFSRLIGQYPDLFARTPFLPALGNHDRQIRYDDGATDAPLYDVEATAFRAFFPLPGDGRYYLFNVPAFGVGLAALDLSHIRDNGSNHQSCVPFDRASEQFHWYRDLLRNRKQRFLITYYNESNANVRSAAGGAWETLIRQGSIAISGFGSFAEHAEVKGAQYFNTGLKSGDDFRDRAGSRFFSPDPSYLLVHVPREGETLKVELKGLDGAVLNRTECAGRAKPGNRRAGEGKVPESP